MRDDDNDGIVDFIETYIMVENVVEKISPKMFISKETQL